MSRAILAYPSRELNLRSSAGEAGSLIPGDKSISHRCALLGALCSGRSVIRNFLVSGVTQAMLDGLTALGVSWTLKGSRLEIGGRGIHGFSVPEFAVDCGNSGTTMRMLAGAVAASGKEITLSGSPGLLKRPMGRIITPLQMMGVDICGTGEGKAPLVIRGRKEGESLRGLDYRMPVASAQVKSCILFAGLGAGEDVVVRENAPSRDHTERLFNHCGIEVVTEKDEFSAYPHVLTMKPPRSREIPPLDYHIPGDISSASFLLAASLICSGSELEVDGVLLNPSRTGFLEALRGMGAQLEIESSLGAGGEEVGRVAVRSGKLEGVRIGGDQVVAMIDEFPIFAVVACFARGKTVVHGARELRFKESDRIAVLCRSLGALGADIQETEDGFVIQGGKGLDGGVVDAHGDHRIAMAMTVAGLAARNPVEVSGVEMVDESFPGFFSVLGELGAHIEGYGSDEAL